MVDLDLINETIQELEQGATSFDSCLKLASLYIIRNENKNANLPADTNAQSDVKKELYDILPGYDSYVGKKIEYQKGNISIKEVEHSFKLLMIEVQEFLDILYNTADTLEERNLLTYMKQNLKF